MQTLLDDGNENVNRDRDPDLSLDGILRGAVESFDPKMLFDPTEKDFNLPARFVEQCYRQCRQIEIIG